MRPAIQRLYDPNQGVRDQAGAQVRQERELAALTDRAMGGYSGYADRNQVEEFGRGAMEMTGAPSWARGIQDVQNGRPGEAIPEFLMGALNTAGIATLPLGGGARAATPPRVPRAPMRPAPALPSRQPLQAATEPPPVRSGPDAGPVQGENGSRGLTASASLDRLLSSPAQRVLHAEDGATVRQMEMGNRPMTMYDFTSSPALTNIRFHPMPDGKTFAIAMSARGVEASSPMSTKAQAFADAMSAIEHHALQNRAARARNGFRYLFTGETDAHTRLFRAMAERAEWPRGAVIHDTPAGFEVSFAPSRAPFSGELPSNGYAHQPEGRPNLGQNGTLRLSEIINNRARQIAGQQQAPQIASTAPDGGPPRPPPIFPGPRNR